MPVPAEVETEKQQIIETAPHASSPAVEGSSQEEAVVSSNGTASPIGEGEQNGDCSACKLFVGGLTFNVEKEQLQKRFEEFGTVKEVKVMKDQQTNKPRGFAFVTFDKEDSVTKVLNSHLTDPLTLDGRPIDPKKAVPHKKLSTNKQIKRIFIGGISSDSVEEDLREYFEQFGTVVDCQLMFDRTTQRHRGFAFVSFGNEEPAAKACSIQFHDIKGKKVEVKVAQTKEALAVQNGKGRTANGRNNYGYMYSAYNPAQNQFYPGSPPYAHEYMAMGGYPSHSPYVYTNGMRKLPRGGKDYQGYPNPYMYAGGWEPSRMPGGFYGPAPGYPGLPIMLRGHPGMDPSMIIPTSGMDYMMEQFQGMTMGGYPPSPMGVYPPMGHMGTSMGEGGSAGGSPQDLSPPPTTTANTFNTQVPAYTGTSHAPYNNSPAGGNY